MRKKVEKADDELILSTSWESSYIYYLVTGQS